MAIRPIAQLKAWFSRGAYPSATQFADWMDSFFHKDETLPISSIDQLPEQLNGKYPADEGEELEKRAEAIAADLNQHKADTEWAFGKVKENLAALDLEDKQIRVDFPAADTATLSAATSHTDAREAVLREERISGDTATLTSAKEHTDERESVLRRDQVAADAATLTHANGYTDGRELGIRRDFAAADATHEAVVRSDMAAGDAAAVQTAQDYTNARETILRADIVHADVAALAAAKTYADNKVAELVSGSPETLDTLRELSTALGDDPNFAATVAAQIGGKVDKVAGKGLSTEDYTSAERSKLAGIAPGANHYTHPASHAASMIDQDALHRFVTDEERAYWDSKSGEDATSTTSGMMSAADKVKLDGVAPGANNYQHPNDANTRHLTDAERAAWNAKAAGDHNHDAAYIPATATCNRNWMWAGQPGQPTWVWGSLNSDEMRVWNPSEFRVAYAEVSGNADRLGGVASLGYARAYGSSVHFGDDATDMTTADFITILSEMGAFAQPYWMARGSWAYSGNRTISDTGIGRIHLAGALVEVAGDVNCYTIRITTPTTSMGGETRRVFIYINNGQEYFPGWFKLANHEIATSSADGLMSAGDKAKLDGIVPGDIFAAWLNGTPKTVYGIGGLQYYNIHGAVGNDPTIPQNPDEVYWHHLVMNHSNPEGYYVDLAFSFFSPRIMFRCIDAGRGSSWHSLWTSANFNPDTKAAVDHTHAGLMTAADKVKIDNLPASAMKSLDVTEAPVSLTVEGGKSYHFNGSALAVLDSSKFTPSADTCIITVPGGTTVAFGNGFRKIAGFSSVVAKSSQLQVFVIQQIPLSGDNYVRAVTRGVYD